MEHQTKTLEWLCGASPSRVVGERLFVFRVPRSVFGLFSFSATYPVMLRFHCSAFFHVETLLFYCATAVWGTQFAQCVPFVSGAAADQQVHSALVWGESGGVDHVHAILPGGLVCGL